MVLHEMWQARHSIPKRTMVVESSLEASSAGSKIDHCHGAGIWNSPCLLSWSFLGVEPCRDIERLEARVGESQVFAWTPHKVWMSVTRRERRRRVSGRLLSNASGGLRYFHTRKKGESEGKRTGNYHGTCRRFKSWTHGGLSFFNDMEVVGYRNSLCALTSHEHECSWHPSNVRRP